MESGSQCMEVGVLLTAEVRDQENALMLGGVTLCPEELRWLNRVILYWNKIMRHNTQVSAGMNPLTLGGLSLFLKMFSISISERFPWFNEWAIAASLLVAIFINVVI